MTERIMKKAGVKMDLDPVKRVKCLIWMSYLMRNSSNANRRRIQKKMNHIAPIVSSPNRKDIKGLWFRV